jgi:hypothetical protein
MKPQINESSVPLKTKRIPVPLHGPILAGLIACLVFNAQAAVQVTRFDPPLNISAIADLPDTSFYNVLGADLNADGEVDFRLAYGWGVVEAYFNAPVRFAQRVSRPDAVGRLGPVAAVPLDSVIGTNIVSAISTNFYVWSPGYTNYDDLTQPLGDHEENVLTANLFGSFPISLGPIITISNGTIVTNIYPGGPFPGGPATGPIASGDVVGKEGVMALEFYVNGQIHYGYIHFNFDGFAGGVIYGWSYETEPNVSIVAKSLTPDILQVTEPANSGIVGLVRGGDLLGGTISVSTHGTIVTNLHTAGGLFEVNLPAGSYVLTPFQGPPIFPGLSVSNISAIGRPRQVTVLRNHFRFVEITP